MSINMNIYNSLREVPDEAKKTITAGRLKGFTDINPMWRIKRMTEAFGPCGIGWAYEIKNKEIIEGANGEKIAVVDIDLFVKHDDKWSRAIPATGGASFVAKEKNGLYTSDECFKMALTDALSVGMKALGMGADVYYQKDRSKYDSTDTESNITAKQAEQIAELINKTNTNSDTFCNHYGINKYSDLTQAQYNDALRLLNGKMNGK